MGPDAAAHVVGRVDEAGVRGDGQAVDAGGGVVGEVADAGIEDARGRVEVDGDAGAAGVVGDGEEGGRG